MTPFLFAIASKARGGEHSHHRVTRGPQQKPLVEGGGESIQGQEPGYSGADAWPSVEGSIDTRNAGREKQRELEAAKSGPPSYLPGSVSFAAMRAPLKAGQRRHDGEVNEIPLQWCGPGCRQTPVDLEPLVYP
ncbi:hypothetical protein B0T26DRAFT_677415 [Lasiosphaeria miniovina]|uniref:Uncharacterized protein n=1 Tax=Lasiosphaeria miniovina TaxID=1954250 RepID=A0AA40ABW8_9PEZI|nr:uncharacterized protein B0T26DRAFT_677415 [Lasiosphaeria miniovina]KAK0713026.1 hypothetical protein B0T26DRAFT_677415 [Lasiosphaeria miniovina]